MSVQAQHLVRYPPSAETDVEASSSNSSPESSKQVVEAVRSEHPDGLLCRSGGGAGRSCSTPGGLDVHVFSRGWKGYMGRDTLLSVRLCYCDERGDDLSRRGLAAKEVNNRLTSYRLLRKDPKLVIWENLSTVRTRGCSSTHDHTQRYQQESCNFATTTHVAEFTHVARRYLSCFSSTNSVEIVI